MVKYDKPLEKGGFKMATSNIENSVKESIAAFNARNIDLFLSGFTNDCVYEDNALGKVNNGREELRNFIKDMFAWSPDVKLEIKALFTVGKWVGQEWIMSGTHTGSTPELPATGKKFSIRGASISELRDGKVSRNTDYWNMAAFLQQIGILPASTIPNRFGRFMMRLMMKR